MKAGRDRNGMIDKKKSSLTKSSESEISCESRLRKA